MSVAVITGASRGLGLALARELVHQGWDLIVDARDGDALESATAPLRKIGKVTAIPGDVAAPAHREAMGRAARRAGRVDLLVNNASTLGPSPRPMLDRYPIGELERVFQVNVVAALAMIQTVLPELAGAHGSIVNVTSDAATEPYEGWGGYGSSKAALEQLTAVLAAEQTSLHVYAFDPGDMRTVMQQEAFPGEDISDRMEPETVVPALMRLIAERPPSGRYRSSELEPTTERAGL
ncbi:MAG: SDR family NAD(P)-dependent oxidoreductase [Actinomycetota bacterium]